MRLQSIAHRVGLVENTGTNYEFFSFLNITGCLVYLSYTKKAAEHSYSSWSINGKCVDDVCCGDEALVNITWPCIGEEQHITMLQTQLPGTCFLPQQGNDILIYGCQL